MKATFLQSFNGCLVVFATIILSSAASAADVDNVSKAKSLFHAAEQDWSRQKWSDAIAKFKRTAEQFPNDPVGIEAQCHYAEALSFVAPPEVAIAEYEKVIQRAPGSFEAHEAKCGIAALKYWLGQHQEAFNLFQQVARETKDWATLKECIAQMKHIERLINLEKHHSEVLSKDCGPKAFAELCRLRGIALNEREMNRLLPIGKQGVSLEAMRSAARTKGVRLVGARLSGDQLQRAARPFIAHLRNNHYLVVTGVKGSRIDYIDPHGRETYTSTNRFHVLWDGAALVPEKGVAGLQKSQLLSKAEMKKIFGGHHLHSKDDGDCGENPASACDDDGCGGAGLPTWQVNLANHNFLVRDLVFSYSGRGPAVQLRLTYSADSTIVSAFGRSWTHNYHIFLRENPDGVSVRRGGAKLDHFIGRADGTFDPPLWTYDELQKSTNDGTYTLKIKRTKETQFFDSQGTLTRIEDRNGNAITFQYDTNGLRTVTDAVGRMTTFNYNAAGLISEVTDPLGRHASYQYDGNSNLVTYIDMAGNVITYTYDAVSYMTSFSTPKGSWQVRRGTTPYFSEFPFILKEIINPLGDARRYDTGATIAWYDDWRNNRYFIYSEGAGETTQITDPEGNTIKRSFSSHGDLTRIIDGNGRSTSLGYDGRGNVTQITDALGNITRFTYDGRDNLLRLVDALGRTNSFVYDAHDNLTRFTDPKGGVTSLGYNGFGQLVSLNDPRTNAIGFAYDARGKLAMMTNAVGGVTFYTNDLVGRAVAKKDPKGQILLYTYDTLDRLLEIHLPDATTRRSIYACCDLSSITDTNGTLGFEYDAASRLTSFTNTFGQVTRYQRDANGNVTNLVYPGGKNVRYAFDRADRMIRVTDWLGNITGYGYDSAGNLLLSTNSNGTFARYQYDSASRLISLINSKADGGVIAAYRLAMDANGNRTNIAIVAALSPGFASTNVNSIYDADNRIVTATSSTFTHDSNGNLTGIGGSKPTTFTYDAFDRLTQVAFSNYMAQHQYDPLGNRISRTAKGITTKYVVEFGGSLSKLLMETDVAGNPLTYYVYGLGLVSMVKTGSQTHFYHYDALGSTVAMTDPLGNAINKYAYEPFGEVAMNSVEATPNFFRYVGALGVLDEQNGLLNMRARYYVPRLGHFLNKDPIGLAGGLNFYEYARNNPVNNVDPSGEFVLFSPWWWVAVGTLVTITAGELAHYYELYKHPEHYRDVDPHSHDEPWEPFDPRRQQNRWPPPRRNCR